MNKRRSPFFSKSRKSIFTQDPNAQNLYANPMTKLVNTPKGNNHDCRFHHLRSWNFAYCVDGAERNRNKLVFHQNQRTNSSLSLHCAFVQEVIFDMMHSGCAKLPQLWESVPEVSSCGELHEEFEVHMHCWRA